MTRRRWLVSLLAFPLVRCASRGVIVVPDASTKAWLEAEYRAELVKAGSPKIILKGYFYINLVGTLARLNAR